ncbi:hypothetical protein [Wolbachia endosymbiont of Tribolium confusum]|uniref:hypothetical protein n=1 Tax=Wolbachia endosymbiont of Tribolium confusum TaxID=214474 RepID=UPI001CF2C8D0|nr:hypothetical protein [Wolbachia endosymbiont of Tribolium confusum]MCA7010883.1 hypothetical protein [Wolbachia endosymbiont of Tribolium confusum]
MLWELTIKITITYDALIPGTADVKAYVNKAVKGWQLVILTSETNWRKLVERTYVLTTLMAMRLGKISLAEQLFILR